MKALKDRNTIRLARGLALRILRTDKYLRYLRLKLCAVQDQCDHKYITGQYGAKGQYGNINSRCAFCGYEKP